MDEMSMPTAEERERWREDHLRARGLGGSCMICLTASPPCPVLALLDALDAAERERDEARATNTRLNGRLTKAEAAMRTTIEDCMRQGVPIGRRLANAGYLMERARAEQAEAALDRVRALASQSYYIRPRDLRAALDGGED